MLAVRYCWMELIKQKRIMIKAFISHSSNQKPFVEDMVKILGRDFCIVDCYNFESAYKTLDEIYRKIDQSTVFVLLLSKDSLASEWVDKEIRYARAKLAPDQLDRFWPFIVDDKLAIEDCPEWVRKDMCFNLRKFHSSTMLAKDIEQKFRKIIWNMDSKRKQIETLMVGRNSDIDAFEEIYHSARGKDVRSIIVSGRDGVGKDMFISQCMNKIGYSLESSPFSISLGNNEGVENFIIQTNLITKSYSSEQLLDILSRSTAEKAQVAASLLNEILNERTVLTIDDDMACVTQNKRVAEWFVELIETSGMNNQLGIFVKSKKVIKSFEETHHPSIGHISLDPLDTKDRRKLFYNLLRIYDIDSVTEEDVEWFIQRLLLSPSQIVKTVEQLSKNTVKRVKEDIDDLIVWGDKQIKPFIAKFTSDEEKRNLLIILSRLDFISYDILEDVYETRIIEAMNMMYEFMDYGIVAAFGPNEEFFRLDHYFSDYIKRCHLSLPKDMEMLLNDVLEEKLKNSVDITEDASLFLYETKRAIMSGKEAPHYYLIPSVVVTSVIEIYNRQDYDQVIKVCDKVLKDVHNYYKEQERELRYWLCLALARTTNDRFFDEVEPLNEVDYYFLRGFYHRIEMKFKEAEKWQRKALDLSPNFARAKRELVSALLAQNKYGEALETAEENYNANPENSYQIHGYFRSLVRKDRLTRNDISMLNELMEAMNSNLSDKHEELYAAMNIEYQLYVNHKEPVYMFSIIREANDRFPNSINIKRAAQPFLYKQNIIKGIESLPENV